MQEYLGPEISLHSIDNKDQILAFLDCKKKKQIKIPKRGGSQRGTIILID